MSSEVFIKPYVSSYKYVKHECDTDAINGDFLKLLDSVGSINAENNRIALNLEEISKDSDGEFITDDCIINEITYVTTHEFLHYLFNYIDDFNGICPCCREHIEEDIIEEVLDWCI